MGLAICVGEELLKVHLITSAVCPAGEDDGKILGPPDSVRRPLGTHSPCGISALIAAFNAA
jgi:hypothetical protein